MCFEQLRPDCLIPEKLRVSESIDIKAVPSTRPTCRSLNYHFPDKQSVPIILYVHALG